ncbi:protein translocase subunit SecD, partial [Kineococcus sp. R8]
MLAVIIVLLFGAVGAGSVWGSARWSPGLALDLEGGTQVVLQARATEGDAPIDATQMEQAAQIIRQRVDATGLSESEVQVQGGRNISVSIPGQATRAQLDLIAQSALLRMRVVLVEAPGAPQPAAPPAGGAAGCGA